MPDQQPTPKKWYSSFFDGTLDIFEEARIMFFGAVVCGWITIWFCHKLGEMPTCGGMLGLIGSCFAALVAKMAWGRNE